MDASVSSSQVEIDLDAVRLALAAALAAHPPQEDGYRLSPDSSTLAEIYATMTFHKIQAMPIHQLDEKQLEALQRWQSTAPT